MAAIFAVRDLETWQIVYGEAHETDHLDSETAAALSIARYKELARRFAHPRYEIFSGFGPAHDVERFLRLSLSADRPDLNL